MTLDWSQDDIYVSNYGAGPLKARILCATDTTVQMERWHHDRATATRFELPLTFFQSPRCGWQISTAPVTARRRDWRTRVKAAQAKRRVIRQAFDLVRHDPSEKALVSTLAGALGGSGEITDALLETARSPHSIEHHSQQNRREL